MSPYQIGLTALLVVYVTVITVFVILAWRNNW